MYSVADKKRKKENKKDSDRRYICFVMKTRWEHKSQHQIRSDKRGEPQLPMKYTSVPLVDDLSPCFNSRLFCPASMAASLALLQWPPLWPFFNGRPFCLNKGVFPDYMDIASNAFAVRRKNGVAIFNFHAANVGMASPVNAALYPKDNAPSLWDR